MSAGRMRKGGTTPASRVARQATPSRTSRSASPIVGKGTSSRHARCATSSPGVAMSGRTKARPPPTRASSIVRRRWLAAACVGTMTRRCLASTADPAVARSTTAARNARRSAVRIRRVARGAITSIAAVQGALPPDRGRVAGTCRTEAATGSRAQRAAQRECWFAVRLAEAALAGARRMGTRLRGGRGRRGRLEAGMARARPRPGQGGPPRSDPRSPRSGAVTGVAALRCRPHRA